MPGHRHHSVWFALRSISSTAEIIFEFNLVRPLGFDHVNELLHHVDVGRLQHPLPHIAPSGLSRRAELRRAAGRRLGQKVVGQRLQAGRIGEARHLQLPKLLRLARAGDLGRHGAVGAHRDRGRPFRNGDARLHRVTLRRHQLPLGGPIEIARPCVTDRAARQVDREIAVAVERKVQRVAGRVERALRLDPRGSLHGHARAQVQAKGVAALRRRR